MVEGPTAHKFAYDIGNTLRNREIRDIYVKSRRLDIDPRELVGRTISNSEAYGKNILIFIDGYAIRLHLMLYGTIHIQKIEEDLKKPFKRIRLKIDTDEYKLVVYNAPIVEIGMAKNIVNNIKMRYGPDPLRDDWDINEAVNRLRSLEGISVSKALLSQEYISGIGNILRNEILYRCKIHPERPIDSLNMDDIIRIIETSVNLSREWLNLKLRGGRLKPLLKVYNKYKGFCEECGEKIVFYIQKDINRKTFYCPRCQKYD